MSPQIVWTVIYYISVLSIQDFGDGYIISQKKIKCVFKLKGKLNFENFYYSNKYNEYISNRYNNKFVKKETKDVEIIG